MRKSFELKRAHMRRVQTGQHSLSERTFFLTSQSHQSRDVIAPLDVRWEIPSVISTNSYEEEIFQCFSIEARPPVSRCLKD